MIEEKVEKFGKYFKDDTEAQVTLSVERNRQTVELTIYIHGTILRVEETTSDMYESVDKAVDKLNRQIKKHKKKLEKRHRSNNIIRFESIENIEEEDESKIVKTKKFPVKPMDAEEAVLQMDLLGHGFFVFMNRDTDEVSVVYKRKDGNYGLIEPTF